MWINKLYIVFFLILIIFQFCFADDIVSCNTTEDCYISTSDLKIWLDHPDLAIVDIRPEEDFKRIRIESSLNIPAYSLRTKSYLRNKKVLLVEKPYLQSKLGKICIDLRKLGFTNVKTLKNGLLDWKNSKNKLIGEDLDKQKLRMISVRDFFSEAYYRPWLLIDTTDSASQIKELEGVEFQSLPLSKTKKDFKRQLLASITEVLARKPGISVAVSSENNSAELKSIVESIGFLDLFIIEGGREAIDSYLKDNQELLTHLRYKAESQQCR
ncbi:MAG: rhodanese-like domain-containing protein [Bdellovibrionales bacterium]|nr:rhodanese-like domain-containing protein [Bdellovibrionales bacterium]